MSDNLGKAFHNQGIDDCIKLTSRWRDDAKEFKDTTPNCMLQYNLLNNLIIALANLKKS